MLLDVQRRNHDEGSQIEEGKSTIYPPAGDAVGQREMGNVAQSCLMAFRRSGVRLPLAPPTISRTLGVSCGFRSDRPQDCGAERAPLPGAGSAGRLLIDAW